MLSDSETPQATFKPATPGLYNLYVEVTDEQGLTARGELLNYTIVDDLAVKSFTATPDNSQTHPIGTTIVLNAAGSGGKTAYQYRFFATFEDGEVIPIQDFSTTETVSFTPPKAGSYDLSLEIKNGSGKIVPETPATIENMIITPVVALTAAKTDGTPAYPADQVSLTVGVSGSKETNSYAYAYSLDAGTTRTAIETSTETGIDFTLPSAGNYRFYVDVIENGEVVAQAESASYPVLTRPSVTLKSDKKSPQNRNTTVKFTASASGGKGPYTYLFACDRDGENIYQGEATTTNMVSLPLTEAGEYTISVIARDANGKEAEQTTQVFQIRDNPLAQLVTNRDQEVNHYAEDEVILEATVDGGVAPFSYRFFYKLGTKTVELTDPVINQNVASISVTPLTAGSYTFIVEVTDQNGLKTTATKTGYKVLAAVATKSFVTDKPSGQNVNSPIKLTANGSGGKTPYHYKFSYQLDGETIELDDKALPSTNTVLFKPTQVGNYTLNVEIKDDNGNGKTTTKTIENFKIVNGPVIEQITAVNKADPEAAIYQNDPILITAALKDGTGTGPIQYRFTIKNGSKVIKTVTQDTNSLEFVPETAGTYSVTVEVVDNDGLTAAQTQKNVVVLKTLTAVLKTDKASGTSINTAIKLSATAAGGKSPYTYTFEWVDALENKETIQEQSTAKTATLTFNKPDDVGLYTLRVTVTDGNGEQAVSELTGYQIKNPPIIEDFTVLPGKGTPVYPGEEITLTTEVQPNSGEAPLSYAFYVNGSSEKLVDNDSDPASIVFEPLSGGTYTFEVVVSDGVSSVSKKISGYKVNPGLEVSSLNASKTEAVIIGDAIQLTAAGKGGVSPYSYQFSYKINNSDGDEIKAETDIEAVDKTQKTISFDQFDEAGTYTFYVEITDKNGAVSLNTVEKALTVTVTDPPVITGLAVTDFETEEPLNTSSYQKQKISLTATNKPEAGGDDLTYTFSYKVGSKSGTIDAADVEGNQASFTPEIPGTYTFYVSAIDNDTDLTSVTYTLSKFVVLKTFGVKSLKTSKPSGQDINTEIKLSAAPDGGKAPYTYAFYQKLRENDADQIEEADYEDCQLPGDAAKNFVTFKPVTEGTYILLVEITDANGVKATESIDFDINNPPVVTLTTNKTGEPVYVGDTVELTATVASGTGIGDMDYLFYWTRGTEPEYPETTTLVNPRMAKANFVPDQAGSYNLFVEVTDDNYVTKTAKIGSFKVLGDVSVKSLVADKKTPQNIGTTIKLTATGTGGKTPYQYQFYYKRDSENDTDDVETWTKIGSQTTSKYVSYRPIISGVYSFGVEITDANKVISSLEEETAVLMDYQVVDPPIIRRFSVAPTVKQYEGEAVTLTTTIAGGSGDYNYQFRSQLGTEEPVTITEDADETPETITFTPEKAGAYKFYVTVTDNKNEDEASNTAEKTIDSYAVIKKATVKDFTISKTSITKGGSIRLSATGQDGIKPYYYQFSMKKDGGSEQIIRAFATTYYYTYKPATAGDYTFYVDIKDSKNETVNRSEITTTLNVTE